MAATALCRVALVLCSHELAESCVKASTDSVSARVGGSTDSVSARVGGSTNSMFARVGSVLLLSGVD